MSNPTLHLTIGFNGNAAWTTDPAGWGGNIPHWYIDPTNGLQTGNDGVIPALDPAADLIISYSNVSTATSLGLTDQNGVAIPGAVHDASNKTLTIPANSGLPANLYVKVEDGGIFTTYTTQITSNGNDSVYTNSFWNTAQSGDGDEETGPDPIGSDGPWVGPTPVYLDEQSSTVLNGTAANDILDLTTIDGIYELDAGFGSWDLGDNYDAEVGIVFIGDQYYEFKGIETYKVEGLSTDTGETIRFNALDDINETIQIGTGYGLDINLGVGDSSDADVVVFTGGPVQFDLSTADSYGYVNYSYSDGTSGSGSIRGADIIIGSAEGTGGDYISGSSQRDVIVGLDGDDYLTGGAGDDFIIGGGGADTIDGGKGDDIIVDLDSDTLTGGLGRDIFVVNGASDDGYARITDLDVSADGLSFRGLDTDKFADRIAFSFSASTLSSALASASGYNFSNISGDPLAASEYYQLARALDLNVAETTDSASQFELSVTYTDSLDVVHVLGKVGFDVSSQTILDPAFNAEDHVYKATLLQAEQVDMQLTEALLDQIAYYATEGVDLPSDDAVTLFVGVERADKNAIFGDGEPVLVAYQPEGIQVATKFRPSNADEVMLGSGESDVYAHSAQVFIDETSGTATGDQDFGSDTIVERGGADDVLSLELSLDDLLVGDLDLARTERGREGDDRSLAVSYAQANGDGTLNSVDLTIYKQFVDYDSSFRVEGIELVDPNGGYETLSLGETISDANIAVDGSTDAILVGRVNKADTFTVRDADTGTNDTADLYLVDFDASVDSLDFSAYASVTSTDPADYADGFETITATRSSDNTTVEYDIYIVGTYTPSVDEDLQQGV